MKFLAILLFLFSFNFQYTFCQKLATRQESVDTIVYKVVDVDPVLLINGKEINFEGVHKFIQAELNWPKTPAFCEGFVFISFIVEKDGTVTNKKFLKNLCPKYDEEAMRVINLLNTWIPGMLKGKEVRTAVTLPIRFKVG